jgi:DNA polymerase epsilon subunit 2
MEALSDTPRLKTDSQFIFVPGPFDPWCGNIFPRPKIPKSFYASLTAGLDKAIFTSNPARLKYCSQEILIFRDDLQNTMRRNCIVPPVESDNLTIEEQVYIVFLLFVFEHWISYRTARLYGP